MRTIYINLATLKLQRSLSDDREVTSMEFKRGAAAPMEVKFVLDEVQTALPVGSVVSFGAKPVGKYDFTPPVFTDDFTESGTGETTKYSGSPSFNSASLNALFYVDEDDSNDMPVVDMMGEFSWGPLGEDPDISSTFDVKVRNSVLQGGESEPDPETENELQQQIDALELDLAAEEAARIAADALKQDELVSSTNIKTINGNSLLGAGDLVIDSSIDNDDVNNAIGTNPDATMAVLGALPLPLILEEFPPEDGTPEYITPLTTLTESQTLTTCPVLYAYVNDGGHNRYADINFIETGNVPAWDCYFAGSSWAVRYRNASSQARYAATSSDGPATPDLATWNAPIIGTGTASFELTGEYSGTPAIAVGQDAILDEESFYKCVRLSPVKWVGPFPA